VYTLKTTIGPDDIKYSTLDTLIEGVLLGVPTAFFKEIDRKRRSNVKWNTVPSSRANMFNREFTSDSFRVNRSVITRRT